MKFGKLPDISTIDFKLPPDPKATRELLAKLPPATDLAEVYIGCTGWSMKEWLGKVYPPKTPAKEFLWYYSRQFNTIELNTTHYRIPDFNTIKKWREESAADFRFCPKIPQSISHSADLALSNRLTEQFTDAIAGLSEKLGCCFMQLPPYFNVDRLSLLHNFLKRWPGNIPLAIEFRHESWFSPLFEEGFDLLRDFGVATVITDVAGRRDVLHQVLTANRVLVRFVGNALHPTDFERIDRWVERLRHWLNSGLKEIYFFTHEPDNILAPDLSLYLAESVQQHCPAHTRGPVFYEAPDGGQMSLF